MKIQNGKIKFSKLEKIIYFSTFVIALLFWNKFKGISNKSVQLLNVSLKFVALIQGLNKAPGINANPE